MKHFWILWMVGILACAEKSVTPDEDAATNDPDEQQELDSMNNTTDTLTFLALGDSYTIGESVAEAERWPVQLWKRLTDSLPLVMETPRIVARTGWTTDELQRAMSQQTLNTRYDLVSLLIGVNNQYRGYPISQFREEFAALLNEAIRLAGNSKGRVLVLSIPDYGVTPFGQSHNPEKIAREIDAYNAICEEISRQNGVAFFNITEISRQATEDPELIAFDRLHPSGKMYGQWVELIYPWAKDIFEK